MAPSHRPVHDKPSLIIDAYQDWILDAVKNEDVIQFSIRQTRKKW